MPHKHSNIVPETIRTIDGLAKFVRTEVEDSQGRWNDNYQTREGYWVIHEGKKHHVYYKKPKMRLD